MYFAALIPLIIISVVITALRSAEQKKRQEAQRQARERQAQTSVPPVQTQQPRPAVRPTVQVPNPARQAAAPTPLSSTLKPPAAPKKPAQVIMEGPPARVPNPKQMHPEHDLCALEPEASHEQQPQTSGGALLEFAPNDILKGILYSEIFGKPKALQ